MNLVRAFPSTLIFSLACLLPAMAAAQGVPAAAAQRLQALDANHDGVLSRYEYDSEAALMAMDVDGNGRISAEELQRYIGPGEQGGATASERIVGSDLDGDGQLSDEELRRSLGFRFNWLDKNKDGNIDPAELGAGMNTPMVGTR
jgi:Ca2+-binding EF-hand superfamily protein